MNHITIINISSFQTHPCCCIFVHYYQNSNPTDVIMSSTILGGTWFYYSYFKRLFGLYSNEKIAEMDLTEFIYIYIFEISGDLSFCYISYF